jgi:hypothetical protein
MSTAILTYAILECKAPSVNGKTQKKDQIQAQRTFDRRSGELNGSLSGSARFTLLVKHYGQRSIFAAIRPSPTPGGRWPPDQAMKILPSSGSDWLALLLVPFKVFVPIGYLIVAIQRETLGHRNDTGAITTLVLNGYMITFFVLVLGAMIQRCFGQRRAYLWTCAFVAGEFFFGFLLLPYLAHT